MRVYFGREDGEKLEEHDMEAAKKMYLSARKVDDYRFVIGSEKDRHLMDCFSLWIGKYAEIGFKYEEINLDLD